MINFEMLVEDSFLMADGSTVFSGSLLSTIELVPRCECELVHEGVVIATFQIDGEILLKNKTSKNRAVSTRHKLSLLASDIARGSVRLRAIEKPMD